MNVARRFLSLAAVSASAFVTSGAPLRVIRTAPGAVAEPTAEISVSFDRPVAGSLENAVDPRSVLKIEPAIAGLYEWRDPVTVRFQPSRPMARDLTVHVTVTTDFAAMDGTRLDAPHEFSFRVAGPRLLASRPVNERRLTQHLRPDQRFDLVYSDSADASTLGGMAYIEMGATCSPRVARVRVLEQRRIVETDGWEFTEAGGWQRDRSMDSLRRVISLAPRAPLPLGCGGELVLPRELATSSDAGLVRLAFATYGPFVLTGATPCYSRGECPTGPMTAHFSTPVLGADVKRHVRIVPPIPFEVSDTSDTRTDWYLIARLTPRTTYAIVADTSLRDMFGQRLTGNPATAARTTGYEPSVTYPFGRQTVERVGFRTLPVQHVNADTLLVAVATVPPDQEAEFLGRPYWGIGDLWGKVASLARIRRVPTRAALDKGSYTGVVLQPPDASRAGAGTMYAVRVGATAAGGEAGITNQPISLVQVTDLGVTARIGVEQGAVWVTGVNDGKPRGNALVILHAANGDTLAQARTDAQGLALLERFAAPITGADSTARPLENERDVEGGYVEVRLGVDRALLAVNTNDPDLASWTFGVGSAWGTERFPVAAALFTERGIYRPGEQVFAKAIVRSGTLGSLRVPSRGDSLRWVFADREGNTLLTRTVALSPFGTAAESLTVSATAQVGTYRTQVQVQRRGAWRTVAYTSYRVAEYRPPEFLMDLAVRTPPSGPGAAFEVAVSARYLFGAPMSGAKLNWEARAETVSPWELDIPGTRGWQVGRGDWGWYEESETSTHQFASGEDSLDARGEGTIRANAPSREATGTVRVVVAAAVTDVNRQVVGNVASALVHPAAFYIAARTSGESWFWRAGEAQRISLRTVRPDGTPVSGVEVQGRLIRREWHRVRRERNGVSQMIGEWVVDTTATCRATTTAEGGACVLTPAGGGMHRAEFEAKDSAGRTAITTMSRWVAGAGFVPWSDETEFRMEVIADRDRYAVGDTATILLAAPFTDAEAWVTVEREQVIEQRRFRITSGAQTMKLPITEAFAPNAFVSIVVVRGRSAPPGPLDDPGRPTMRVGYAQLRVTPEVKRLAVKVGASKSEYRPGDTATVKLEVRDAAGAPARSEVTLWAVDMGVLALTGYKTPDPLDLIYKPRQLGLRLASNLVSVTPQVAEGEKGRREAGGGGGADAADVLRSRFKTTAFFLGSVVTDAQGKAEAKAKLPDNLTTFRVMAVAVTAEDRYGNGESPMLVTRPVVARPALPRFVRPGDDFRAGTVVNRRDGAAATVSVKATATGIRLADPAEATLRLQASRPGESRFRFIANDGDSAAFRFDVKSGTDLDAVRVAVPVKPDHHPRAHVIAGVLHDSTTAEFLLPADIDLGRSRLTVNVGSSPLSVMRGMTRQMRVYSYECTEQISSRVGPILALLRADKMLTDLERARLRTEAERGIRILLSRQRADGAIGYWASTDWSTPWLSSYAANVLAEAKEVGLAVDTAALGRLGGYLRAALRGEGTTPQTPVSSWYDHRGTRLADQVAAVDFLSRIGEPDVASENELLRSAGILWREDRIRFAEVLARRGAVADARRLLSPIWASVSVEGRTASLPSDTLQWYFGSTVRETGRLLTATLAVDARHQLVGPLVERLVTEGRGASRNTQDRAAAVRALAVFDARPRDGAPRAVTVRMGTRVVARTVAALADTTMPLTGLVGPVRGEVRSLRLQLGAAAGSTEPTFYYLTVSEVSIAPPVRPAGAGINVERWYERFSDGTPVTTVAEGELVRVRLKVTVPRARQFVVLDDPLPAGVEVVDLSLRTETLGPTGMRPPEARGGRPDPGEGAEVDEGEGEGDEGEEYEYWSPGRWDGGRWTPWEHRELRDDRVIYSASTLWAGTWQTSYVVRATTPGTFIVPPAHAEEMYNPAVNGRSAGGKFVVTSRPPR